MCDPPTRTPGVRGPLGTLGVILDNNSFKAISLLMTLLNQANWSLSIKLRLECFVIVK